MKHLLIFIFIITAATANGQKLKDLLYSGKLKSDSGSVVRKTDDLKSKIDTTQKKVVEVEKAKTTPVATQQAVQTSNTSSVASPVVANEAEVKEAAEIKTSAAPVKSNNKIWKEYTEELTNGLKDVIASKKVKKESYYFTVEYEIGTDGVTSIKNITSSPDNAILTDNVKQRITETPPQLTPSFDSNNKPIKVKKRYNFFINKD